MKEGMTVWEMIALFIVSILWLYVVARVVTRGIMRTIEERRRDKDG